MFKFLIKSFSEKKLSLFLREGSGATKNPRKATFLEKESLKLSLFYYYLPHAWIFIIKIIMITTWNFDSLYIRQKEPNREGIEKVNLIIA